jgi:hypothetical protein
MPTTILQDRATVLGGQVRRPDIGIKPPPQLERVMTVNFDDVPDGTVIDTHYPGLTFASLTTNPPSRGSAFARRLQIAALGSAKNVLTLSMGGGWTGPFFDARQGAVEVKFDQLQRSVSVQALPLNTPEPIVDWNVDDNRPFMEAFDAAGGYLGRVRAQAAPGSADYFMHWHTLTFTSPSANIRSVRLSSQAHGSAYVYAVFDLLTYRWVLRVPQ